MNHWYYISCCPSPVDFIVFLLIHLPKCAAWILTNFRACVTCWLAGFGQSLSVCLFVGRITKTRAKDVLPNKPHAGRRNHPTPQRRNGTVCCCCGPFVRCRDWWECTARFLSLVTLTFDLWPWHSWHSNFCERGTKHVLPVNLAQIRSSVPEIFDSQTDKNKKSQSAL